MTKLGEAVFAIVRLPDGRYAIRNERDVSDLTERDVLAIAHALQVWWPLLLDRKRGT